MRDCALRGAPHRLAPAAAPPGGAQGKGPAPPAYERETLRVPRVRLQTTPVRLGRGGRVFTKHGRRAKRRDVLRARRGRERNVVVVVIVFFLSRRLVFVLLPRRARALEQQSLAVRSPRALRSSARAPAPVHGQSAFDRESVPGRASRLPKAPSRRRVVCRVARGRRREAGFVDFFGALRVRPHRAPVPRVVAGGPAAQVTRETRRAEEPAGARAERIHQHADLRSGLSVIALITFLGCVSFPYV